jgi:raffinose/stachyose/melibiose transport system substrate-binding protein
VVQGFDTKFWTKGYLTDMTGMKELEHFSNLTKSAWSTADGKTNYAIPVASVMHGFMYNKTAFDELKLQPPETVADFMAVLEAIKKDGRYIPLAYGTADAWNPAIVAYDAVGPAYWGGEAGRWDLINGKSKMTDKRYTDPWKFLASWAPYMPENYESVTYSDGQQLFLQGKAIIRPVGSWEITIFENKTSFPIGIFTPPVVNKGDKCYVNDWIDMAFAINKVTKHPAEAKQMAEWFGSKEFAELYTNSLPGFFTLSDYQIDVKDPLAKEFLSWRGKCEMTLRLEGQYLSAGTPNLTDDLWRLTQQVMNLKISPEQAGIEAQKGLDAWYKPPTP